jgi:chemotaxis protein MotB
VSYADFITLLFGFFVVLYAFAKADQKKQMLIPASIDSAFNTLGILHGPPVKKGNAGSDGSTPAGVMAEELLSPAQVKDDLDRIRRELEQTLASQVASHTVSIQMGRDGLVVSLREAGFFDSGSATPKPDALPTLRKVAASLGQKPYDLRIEGHTDSLPIHNAEFDSNWELSTARATQIARLLLDLKTVPADRISVAGYAEFHPVASNDTPEGRAENRRVDLVVLPRTKIDFSAGGSKPSSGAWLKITDGD